MWVHLEETNMLYGLWFLVDGDWILYGYFPYDVAEKIMHRVYSEDGIVAIII